jgi:hypothetical protein
MGEKPRPQTRRLVLLIWILVAIFYYYLSYDYIQVTMNDRRLGEYVDYVVQLAGTERRPQKEVRTLILVKADELGLPLRGEQIAVTGEGPGLRVAVNYEVDVEFPGIDRVLYRKAFEHRVAYRAPQ